MIIDYVTATVCHQLMMNPTASRLPGWQLAGADGIQPEDLITDHLALRIQCCATAFIGGARTMIGTG